MSTKYVSGRVKELKVGLSNYSETRESLSVVGNANIGGIVTATSFSGSVSGSSVSEWVLGADGTNNYTFTGPGLTGAENDPVIYYLRGMSRRLTEDSKGACKDWKKAAELGDKDSEELLKKYCS